MLDGRKFIRVEALRPSYNGPGVHLLAVGSVELGGLLAAVVLAKRLGYSIVTNDYNLNRVAELQGVRVLNINELANAVRAVFLPGESLVITIVQVGKEIGQGVGYLDDGTMVVVESGSRYVDRDMEVVVTKVLQTSAGRMLFARLAD